MIRLIFLVLLIFVLYKVLHLLIRDKSAPKNSPSNESAPEELVFDPMCKTYIPRRSAIRKNVSGHEVYFCSDECLSRYLDQEAKRQIDLKII